MPLVCWQDSYRRVTVALRVAKLMAYDLGASELLLEEVIERLDAVLPLSLGAWDVRAAVLESCRYLHPPGLVYASDRRGRQAVLCRED
eukprot:3013961-Alexandrium_andersonii.AAC.1